MADDDIQLDDEIIAGLRQQALETGIQVVKIRSQYTEVNQEDLEYATNRNYAFLMNGSFEEPEEKRHYNA